MSIIKKSKHANEPSANYNILINRKTHYHLKPYYYYFNDVQSAKNDANPNNIIHWLWRLHFLLNGTYAGLHALVWVRVLLIDSLFYGQITCAVKRDIYTIHAININVTKKKKIETIQRTYHSNWYYTLKKNICIIDTHVDFFPHSSFI